VTIDEGMRIDVFIPFVFIEFVRFLYLLFHVSLD
jgi:hypothetical protein